MTEKEYLDALNKALKWLPKSEKDLCFDYAREMIEDRIENGLSESEAVAQLETPQQLAKAFLEDRGSLKFKFSLPLNNVSTLILLILGFPLWGTLLLAGLMILLAGFLIAGCVPFICVVMTVSLLLCRVGQHQRQSAGHGQRLAWRRNPSVRNRRHRLRRSAFNSPGCFRYYSAV